MDYAKKSSYSFFDYNITEKFLPIKYTGDFSLVSRNGIDLENTTIKNPEIFPCVRYRIQRRPNRNGCSVSGR